MRRLRNTSSDEESVKLSDILFTSLNAIEIDKSKELLAVVLTRQKTYRCVELLTYSSQTPAALLGHPREARKSVLVNEGILNLRHIISEPSFKLINTLPAVLHLTVCLYIWHLGALGEAQICNHRH